MATYARCCSFISYISVLQTLSVGYGVTVNITASHAVARGSIPRIRISFSSPPNPTLSPHLPAVAVLTHGRPYGSTFRCSSMIYIRIYLHSFRLDLTRLLDLFSNFIPFRVCVLSSLLDLLAVNRAASPSFVLLVLRFLSLSFHDSRLKAHFTTTQVLMFPSHILSLSVSRPSFSFLSCLRTQWQHTE